MTRPRLLLAACGLLALAMGLGGCSLSLQSLPKLSSLSGPTYPVRAEFADVLNLPDDAQVRIGAAVVGQVSSISTTNYQADLTLSIKKEVKLPVGTSAQIRFDNPLGAEYVMLQSPAGGGTGYLPAGSLIPQSQTSTAPSVEDTLAALSLVLNGGGINQLQTIIHELNDTFAGNQPQIRDLLTTIDTGAKSVANGKATIDAALASMASLSEKLNAGRSVIANGLATISPAVGVLASENKQLSSLVAGLSRLGQVGTEIAQESGQDSVNDLKDLLPVVDQLNAVSQQLGPDLKTLAAFEADTPKVAPGAYLQVQVIANVLLPSGAFEPTPVSDAASAPASSAQTAGAAVTGLLGTGAQ
ncbi:MAG: MCE family protein [Acidimicrobiales bacterium]